MKVFGDNLQYSLSVEGPWKQFQDRDVHNVNEAAELVYDVSTQITNREAAFMVFQNRLATLNDMPTVLEECARMMQTAVKRVTSTDRWKAVAKKNRANLRDDAQQRLKLAREAFFHEQTLFSNTYPGDVEPVDDDQKTLKAGRREMLNYLQNQLTDAGNYSLRIEGETEGGYTHEEESAARRITGEPVGDGESDPDWSKINDEAWHGILKKILRIILVAAEDRDVESKWGEVCKSRLDACVVNDKQLLQFAEELEREAKMYNWGACLFAGTNQNRREKKANKIGLLHGLFSSETAQTEMRGQSLGTTQRKTPRMCCKRSSREFVMKFGRWVLLPRTPGSYSVPREEGERRDENDEADDNERKFRKNNGDSRTRKR